MPLGTLSFVILILSCMFIFSIPLSLWSGQVLIFCNLACIVWTCTFQVQIKVLQCVRFKSTKTQEGGELYWQIFVSFWKQGRELFGQGVCSESRNGVAADVSRKVNRSTRYFYMENTSSPTAVKKPRPTPVRFSHTSTIRAKHITR